MRERLEQILKILCFVLAALLLVQLVRAARHINPLAGAAMPALPSLPADTNELASAAMHQPTKMATHLNGTNTLHGKAPGTNAPGTNGPGMMATGTNAPGTNSSMVTAPGTNALSAAALGTNMSPVNGSPTNGLTVEVSTTNTPGTNTAAVAKSKEERGNAEPLQAMASVTNHSETKIAAAIAPGTNVEIAKASVGTNIAIGHSNHVAGTNPIVTKNAHPKNFGPGFPPMMGGVGGKKPANLPPDIQARVNRVTESEILGPVMHPMPMALLGIAGNVAFLRSSSGQTGLVKEGDELGDIKLLRIGINRVLIEQNGEKKELMIFNGFGGQSLLPKPTESSDETTKKQ